MVDKNQMEMKTSSMILFICAGLMLSGGTVLCSSTTWSLLRMSYYFWTTDLGVELASGVLLVAGALLCLPACWLCTLLPYHTKNLTIMTTLTALAATAMVVLSLGLSSAGALSRTLREPAVINGSMLRAMARSSHDPTVSASFAAMELELGCCGVESFSDWYEHRRTLPPTCCGRVFNGKTDGQCQKPVYTAGCLRSALKEMQAHTNAVSTLAGAVIIILAVTLFTTAYVGVNGSLARDEMQYKLQPLRIACITQPPLGPLTPALQHVQFATPQTAAPPPTAL
ncbi:hypothetical protein ACJJTC_007053 [Scirpophaga incertulas]